MSFQNDSFLKQSYWSTVVSYDSQIKKKKKDKNSKDTLPHINNKIKILFREHGFLHNNLIIETSNKYHLYYVSDMFYDG